jgi:hypothetical protein
MSVKPSSCSSVLEWMHRPNRVAKKVKLSIITAVVVLILALGVSCYFFEGGRFASIPGYNQNYAFALWAIDSAIVLGTAIFYLVRASLSRYPYIPSSSVEEVSEMERKKIFERLSFHEALTKNTGIKWLTKNLVTSEIPQLSPEEESAPPFVNFISTFFKRKLSEPDQKAVLATFEERKSSFLAARDSND